MDADEIPCEDESYEALYDPEQLQSETPETPEVEPRDRPPAVRRDGIVDQEDQCADNPG
jgi:hypothetical protein